MRNRGWLFYGSIFLVVLGLIALGLAEAPSWFWHPLGYCTGSKVSIRDCKGYNSWSGSFSDIGEVTIVGGMITLVIGFWRHVNCHVDGCYRIGRHKMAGGKYVLCTKCLKSDPEHPDEVTREHVHAAHRQHLARVQAEK
jgi:hypothetical protein